MGIEKVTQQQRFTSPNIVIGGDNIPIDTGLSVYGKITTTDNIRSGNDIHASGNLSTDGTVTANSFVAENGLTVNNGNLDLTGGSIVNTDAINANTITFTNGIINNSSTSFISLSDIKPSGANDGDTIQWSSSQNKWIPVGEGSAGKIVAWAYIDCSKKIGSYVRPANSSIVTLTITNHGFNVGSTISAFVQFEGGELNTSSVDNNVWNATIATANTITFNCGVTSTDEKSGNANSVSIHSPVIRGSNNVSNVVLDLDNVPNAANENIRFTLNFINPLINPNYAVIANAYYYPGGGIVDGDAYEHGAFVQVDNRLSQKTTSSFKFVVVDPTNNTYATERDTGKWPFIHLMVVG